MLLLGLAAIITLFTILWLVSLRLEDSSIIDIAWGPGILFLALTYYFTSDGAPARARLTLALVAIWAIRIAAHLFVRNRLQGEDFRYEMLRTRYGRTWWWFSYVRVFLLQSVLAWIVSIPLYFAIVSVAPRTLTIVDFVGVLFFAAGFLFETIGDEQLRQLSQRATERQARARDRIVAVHEAPELFWRSADVVGPRPDRRCHRRRGRPDRSGADDAFPDEHLGAIARTLAAAQQARLRELRRHHPGVRAEDADAHWRLIDSPPVAPDSRRSPRWLLPLLLVLFFASGACALIYQVMWLRLLSLVFGVTVYAASTVLAGFMAGLGVGSFVAGRVAAPVPAAARGVWHR